MSAEYFLNTNILIYRFSEQEARKRIIAANRMRRKLTKIKLHIRFNFRFFRAGKLRVRD